MKAVVYHGVGDIRLEDVPEPRLKHPTDAIVRLTASAICGTDLHMVRGTMAGMAPGTVMGHEGVGIIEELGRDVRNLKVGDRVVIASTIACGSCSYCRAGYFAQCDGANPAGKLAGTAFFGGPAMTGAFDGLQAEKARIPFAHVGLVKLPDDVRDDQAIILSDIFPTGWMAAENAEIKPGNVVAVFGCGPVGLLSILSAKLMGAGRVIAVDRLADRLDRARDLGAETVNFDEEGPVDAIRRMTGGIGADRVIDAVGVDAEHPDRVSERLKAALTGRARRHKADVKAVAPRQNPDGSLWRPGDAPSQVLDWAVQAVDKAGTVSIIGVYPETMTDFPVGSAMNKNLTIKMGNCSHRRYIPKLLELVQSGVVDPAKIVSKHEPIGSAIEAYKAFDQRKDGWIKVELAPAAV